MRLSLTESTTAVSSMLVSPWCALHCLSRCFVQLLGLLVVFQNLTMSHSICVTFSTSSQHIEFRNLVWRCQLGSDKPTCWSVVAITSSLTTHRYLRSASRGEFVVPSPTIPQRRALSEITSFLMCMLKTLHSPFIGIQKQSFIAKVGLGAPLNRLSQRGPYINSLNE